jgi:hypothetical protein
MTGYNLAKYEDKLNRQVIHMDQGVAYSPEFRATFQMTDYPSRKMQIARAIFKGELEASPYSAEILNLSILSRQGERWQNFGEDQEDYTDCLILAREMLVKKGLNQEIQQELADLLKQNNGHLFPISSSVIQTWQQFIPTSKSSKRYLLLDDASCALVPESASAVGRILETAEVSCVPDISPRFLGWEYFAYGMIEQGLEHVRTMVEEFQQKGINELVVLTGQAEYLWRAYLPKLGVHHGFRVTKLMDLENRIQVPEQSFVYAGSFLTRYLMMGEVLSRAIPNSREQVLPRSEEFIQTYLADKRVNDINIWQKPLCAEFVLFGLEEVIKENIFEDAYADISRAPHKNLVVFEPFAYALLKQMKPKENLIYFANCLI